jgi:hypothetical protein
MSTNAVVFRTERIRFHLDLAGGHPGAGGLASERGSGAPVAIAEIEDPADAGDALIERLEAARARWAQLTFYLFDADSWR